MNKLSDRKFIWVKWKDATFSGGRFESPKEITKYIILETAGILANEDRESLSVSIQYRSDEHSYRDTLSIPKSLIIQRRVLRIKDA